MNKSYSNQSYPFPSDLIDPKKKAEKKFGIKWAKAIYYNNGNDGSSMFHNDRNVYRKYMAYALGKQDENQYKPLLGVNSNNIKDSMLPAIRWGIRNYATKKINVVVSNISNKKFDPVAKAVDPLANNLRKDYKSNLQAYVHDRQWLEELASKSNINTAPAGLDASEVPTNHEDIEIAMRNSFKFMSELELEDGIKYHLERNNYEQVRKQIIWDLFVLGVGALDIDIDEYGDPSIERVPPEDLFVPYSEMPDFSNINYTARVKRLTVAELKKLAGDEFTDQEYQEIEDNFTNSTDRDNSQGHRRDGVRSYNDSRDVKKVEVLMFEYVSQDEHVHLKKKDKSGNERLARKDYNYYATEKEQTKFKKKFGKERSILRTPYTSVYKGCWIVGSDLMFKYKRKSNLPSKRNAFGGTPMGIKLFAPNLFTGEVVSTVKQMIPILDTLQHYQLKIQHIVASAVPKGMEIDLWKLSQAEFIGRGGEALSDLEKIEMWQQAGILLTNSGGRITPGANNSAVTEMENGMAQDVVKLMDLIQKDLEALDEVVGVNRVMAGGNLHQDTGKATAGMQLQSAHTAIDYIYDADEYVSLEMCKTLSTLHIQSVKTNGNKKKYSDIFGENSVRFLTKDHGIDKHDFGIYLEPRPSDEDWQLFYADINKAVDSQQIGIDDAARVRRLDNLKRAEEYLAVSIAKREKQARADKENDIKMNGQVQQESAQMANDLEVKLLDQKMMVISAQGEEDRKTLQLKYQLEKNLQGTVQTIKADNKIQETSMISKTKENVAVLSSIDKEKNESKPGAKQ